MRVVRCLLACGALGASAVCANPPAYRTWVPPPPAPGCATPGMVSPGTPNPGMTSPTPPTAGTPPTSPTPDGTAPGAAGAAAGAAAAGSGVSGGGGEGGSGSLATSAPNMFGDAFGGRPLSIALPTGGVFTGQQSYILFPQGPFAFTGTAGQTQLDPAPAIVNARGNNVFLPNGISLVNPAPQDNPRGTRLPVAETPEFTNAVRRLFTPAGQVARFNPTSAALVLVNGGAIFNGAVDERYDFFTQLPTTAIAIPSGGVVGRTKVSEDNNPLPRDRVIFNYDYFSQVSIGPGGVGVHRYVAGFEKTFLDQNASVEVRLPFASTSDNEILADGVTGRATQVGNLGITVKGLLVRSDTVAVAAGFGVSLPTADDVRVRLVDGTDLVRVKNQSVFVTPYVAALFTPSDRTFVQTWAAYGVDANGSQTDVNGDFTGLRRAGRFTDQNLAQLDAQVGYWVYRAADRSATLQGVSPFAELHYNATVGRADVINAGAFQVGQPGSLNELNASFGATTQLGSNFLLSGGVVLPLKGNFDRTFDYQLGLRGTWFFGPTARSLDAASRVSSF